MNKKITPELLTDTIESYFHVDSSYEWDRVKRYLNNPNFPERANKFRQELAEAILNRNISLTDLEYLTSASFDSEEEGVEYLKEIWEGLYGSELITLQKAA